MSDVYPAIRGITKREFRTLDVCCPECTGRGHNCSTCDDRTVVCPTCKGARWVNGREENRWELKLFRCSDCGLDMSTGWEFDAEREAATVERWLTVWRRERDAARPDGEWHVEPGVAQEVTQEAAARWRPPTPEEDALVRASLRPEPVAVAVDELFEDDDDLPF